MIHAKKLMPQDLGAIDVVDAGNVKSINMAVEIKDVKIISPKNKSTDDEKVVISFIHNDRRYVYFPDRRSLKKLVDFFGSEEGKDWIGKKFKFYTETKKVDGKVRTRIYAKGVGNRK